jgi:hypothetical protein
MSTLILLLSLLWPSPETASKAPAVDADDEVRYRGIEALLARFEAQAAASDQNL